MRTSPSLAVTPSGRKSAPLLVYGLRPSLGVVGRWARCWSCCSSDAARRRSAARSRGHTGPFYCIKNDPKVPAWRPPCSTPCTRLRCREESIENSSQISPALGSPSHKGVIWRRSTVTILTPLRRGVCKPCICLRLLSCHLASTRGKLSCNFGCSIR